MECKGGEEDGWRKLNIVWDDVFMTYCWNKTWKTWKKGDWWRINDILGSNNFGPLGRGTNLSCPPSRGGGQNVISPLLLKNGHSLIQTWDPLDPLLPKRSCSFWGAKKPHYTILKWSIFLRFKWWAPSPPSPEVSSNITHHSPWILVNSYPCWEAFW